MKHKTIHELHFLYKIWKHLVHDTEHAKESFYDISYLFFNAPLIFWSFATDNKSYTKDKRALFL